VLILRMLLGAFRPPKPENRICCGKAQYGCQPIERRKAEDKLPAAQPTEIEASLWVPIASGLPAKGNPSKPPAVPSSTDHDGSLNTRTASTPLRTGPSP
jgi:hypothetical protein